MSLRSRFRRERLGVNLHRDWAFRLPWSGAVVVFEFRKKKKETKNCVARALRARDGFSGFDLDLDLDPIWLYLERSSRNQYGFPRSFVLSPRRGSGFGALASFLRMDLAGYSLRTKEIKFGF